MAQVVDIYASSVGGKVYTTASPAYNSGSSFKFPYDQASSKDVILDVRVPSKNLYITKISNSNRFYFNGAYSRAITINNNALILKNLGNPLAKKYANVKKLNSGTTLANCVGWAHGRVNEIWHTAISSGYIKKVDGKWVIPSKNNKVITCGREPSASILPAGDAWTFYDNWPSSDGWYKSSKSQDDQRPLPGAIVCWKSVTGGAGHVGVVEAVYNWGQADEYIVISESGYSLYGAEKIVFTEEVYRKNTMNGAPYACPWAANYKFLGFLFSPVCQLLPDGSVYNVATKDYDDTPESIEILKADAAAYKDINDYLKSTGKKVLLELVKNQKVRITWFGSSTPDETNSKINLLDGEGVIVSVDNSNAYPYAVSITGDGKISGYFTRDALKAIGDSND